MKHRNVRYERFLKQCFDVARGNDATTMVALGAGARICWGLSKDACAPLCKIIELGQKLDAQDVLDHLELGIERLANDLSSEPPNHQWLVLRDELECIFATAELLVTPPPPNGVESRNDTLLHRLDELRRNVAFVDAFYDNEDPIEPWLMPQEAVDALDQLPEWRLGVFETPTTTGITLPLRTLSLRRRLRVWREGGDEHVVLLLADLQAMPPPPKELQLLPLPIAIHYRSIVASCREGFSFPAPAWCASPPPVNELEAIPSLSPEAFMHAEPITDDEAQRIFDGHKTAFAFELIRLLGHWARRGKPVYGPNEAAPDFLMMIACADDLQEVQTPAERALFHEIDRHMRKRTKSIMSPHWIMARD